MTTVYTIYEKPKDYPDHIVLRKWTVDHSTGKAYPGPVEVCDSLAEARSKIPRGFHNMRRMPGDDHTIVESWI